ncbi:MAG TPA: helix-turn-helix transcriptional regulator [Bacillota bacterium]|nr:helix-turn-helix transcriptional regulator [Bacillota bacterium]
MFVIQNDKPHQEILREEYGLLIRFIELRHSQTTAGEKLANEFDAVVYEYERLLDKIAKIIHTGAGDSKLPDMVQPYTALQSIEIQAPNRKGGFIQELEDAIEEKIADPEFSVEDLSQKLHMNRVTLYRKVRAITGETPSEFIRSYRLKRGAELLQKNFGTVLDVALEVGFSSAAYFTKCFKRKFGLRPSEV